jgi:hypothetical protein
VNHSADEARFLLMEAGQNGHSGHLVRRAVRAESNIGQGAATTLGRDTGSISNNLKKL